jgi:hypothetical protein
MDKCSPVVEEQHIFRRKDDRLITKRQVDYQRTGTIIDGQANNGRTGCILGQWQVAKASSDPVEGALGFYGKIHQETPVSTRKFRPERKYFH